MTLPASGTISMQDVNNEFVRAPTTQVALGDSDVRTLANVPSGTISMSDLYGKSAPGTTPPTLPNGTVEVYVWSSGLDATGWNNDNNILDGSDATSANSSIDNPNSGNPKHTNYLVGRNLGLAVPAGRILTDLKFEYSIHVLHSAEDIGPQYVDRIALFNNTTVNSLVKSNLINDLHTPAPVLYTINGDSAFWGVSLTTALVTDPLFGAGLSVRNYSNKGNDTVFYTWMRVTASW